MNTLDSFKENNPQFADTRNDRWFGLLENPDEETLSQLAFFLGSRFLWISGNAPDIPNPDGDTRIRTLAVFKSNAAKETAEEIFHKVRLVHPEYGDRRNAPFLAQCGSSAKALEAVQVGGALYGKLYLDSAFSSDNDELIKSFLKDNEKRLGIQSSPYNCAILKNYLEQQGPEVNFDLIDRAIRTLGRTDTKDTSGVYGALNYHPIAEPAVIPKKVIKRNPWENSHPAHSQRIDAKEAAKAQNPLLNPEFQKANARAKEEVERLINTYTVRNAVGTSWSKTAEAKAELLRIKIMSSGTVLNEKTGEQEHVELFTEKLRKCKEVINKYERLREKSR